MKSARWPERSRSLEIMDLKSLVSRPEQAEAESKAETQRRTDMERLASAFENTIGEIVHGVASAASIMETSASSLKVTAEKNVERSTISGGGCRDGFDKCQDSCHVERGDGFNRSADKHAG